MVNIRFNIKRGHRGMNVVAVYVSEGGRNEETYILYEQLQKLVDENTKINHLLV